MKTKVLYPIVAMVLALALASTACAIGAQPEPTATVTPVPPTATPIPPTPTPVPPTATATPVPPTATPDLAATVAAAATQQAAAVVADIQAFLTSLELPTEGELGWYQDEPISVVLEGYQDWQYQPFAEGLEASDFILKTDITWESSGWPTCGIMFRTDPSYVDYYWARFLRLSGLPGWDIEYFKDDNYIFAPTGSDLRFSEKLDQGNGATNEIVLVVEGNKFIVYINGQRQGQFFDDSKKLMKGYFAFSAWHESGTTTCTHTDTWIWLTK